MLTYNFLIFTYFLQITMHFKYLSLDLHFWSICYTSASPKHHLHFPQNASRWHCSFCIQLAYWGQRGFYFQNFTSSQSRYWPKIASQCFISMRLPNSSICKGAKYHHVKFNLDAENHPCKQKLAEKQRCKKMPSPFSSKPIRKFIQQKQKSMRPPNSDGSRWKGSFTDLLVGEINAQKSVPKRPPCKTSFQPDTADLNMAARFHPSRSLPTE